ncbi:NAD(P)H-dependent oxidoreductase [Sphingosinicellaceae bacterium]|nr:NAD(P)H-dependent oxidoreductase [Sphingosinicellaceae bacterium]
MTNVAVIVGSARTGSITRKVADAMINLAPQDLNCQIVPIAQLPMYNQDLDGSPPVEWVAFRDLIRGFDAVLFATPEYNRSMPALLKNAIDIGSRPYGHSVWSKKPAAVVSVTRGAPGGFGANHAVRQCLVFLDMPILQQPEAYIGNAPNLFNEDGSVIDASKSFLAGIMTAFAFWISRTAV